MRASWREIKNRTMAKRQQARARALAKLDLAKIELRIGRARKKRLAVKT